jgi:hypothetical protein
LLLSLLRALAIVVAVSSPAAKRKQPRSTRRKTSFEVDTAKVEAAKGILGTTTLTETVDAALSEVAKLEQRRRLAELLFAPDALQLDDPDVMAGAWR